MLIDPQGLFYGERISACSDEAQLHFPRLMAASNGFGRIEMSVVKLHATVYAGFKVKPSKAELQGYFREYHANFLLFVYKTDSGEVWGQWAVSKGKLPQYKTAADNRSPAPPYAEFSAFQRAYVEAKRLRYAENDDHISILEDLENLPKCSKGLETFLHGEVVGVGEVVGEEVGEILAQPTAAPTLLKPSAKTANPLHGEIRKLFGDAPWDGAEGKALDELLRAVPKITLERVQVCLVNRAESDVNPVERPRKWIRNLLDYELGPLDAFGKPKALRKPSPAAIGMARAPSTAETATRLQREASEKRDIVNYWRELRTRGSPMYANEAPRWVKEALEAEQPEAKVA